MDAFTHNTSIANNISEESLAQVCASLLQKGKKITVRNVHDEHKELFGIGGSFTKITTLLKKWKSDNKRNFSDKDSTDEILNKLTSHIAIYGGIDENVPEEFWYIANTLLKYIWTLAYQEADTAINGKRVEELFAENEKLKTDLADFPQIQAELKVLRESQRLYFESIALANQKIDAQKLAESENLQNIIKSLHEENQKLELENKQWLERSKQIKASEENQHNALQELETEVKKKQQELKGEVHKLTRQLSVRQSEVDNLQAENKNLNEKVGEMEIYKSELDKVKKQLEDANKTIATLQAAKLSPKTLQVDIELDEIIAEKEEYQAMLSKANQLLLEHGLQPVILNKEKGVTM